MKTGAIYCLTISGLAYMAQPHAIAAIIGTIAALGAAICATGMLVKHDMKKWEERE